MMRVFAIAAVVLAASTGVSLAQDAAAGEKVFGKCKTCHEEGENAKVKVGPPLNGVTSRPAGSWPGFAYSAAMKAKAPAIGNWDEAKIVEYLQNPSKYLGGTSKMVYMLPAEQERKNVVAYLAQFGMDGKKK